jgi:hypothetical protein
VSRSRAAPEATDVRHLRWPAERFYWAVLDAPGLRRAGELPPGLRGAFEDEAPAPDLHIVCAPIRDGRALACGAPNEALAPLQALSLCPDGLPDLGVEVDPRSLNLLVGAFEPPMLKRIRTRRRTMIVAALALTAAFTSIGLARRAAHDSERARSLDRAAQGLARAVVPAAPQSLGAELERARRAAGVQVKPPPDAALTLAAVLAGWPTQVTSRPQSIVIGGETASLSVNVEGDSTPFLQALHPPAGWVLEEPRLTAAGTLTRLTLQLRRRGGGGP